MSSRAPDVFDVEAGDSDIQNGLYYTLEAALAAAAKCHHPSVLAHLYFLRRL